MTTTTDPTYWLLFIEGPDDFTPWFVLRRTYEECRQCVREYIDSHWEEDWYDSPLDPDERTGDYETDVEIFNDGSSIYFTIDQISIGEGGL